METRSLYTTLSIKWKEKIKTFSDVYGHKKKKLPPWILSQEVAEIFVSPK